MRLLTLDGRCNCSGKKIRKAREDADLSQEQLAAKIQLRGHALTQKAISRVESGQRIVPDFEIPLFAEALGVDPLWLLGMKKDTRSQVSCFLSFSQKLVHKEKLSFSYYLWGFIDTGMSICVGHYRFLNFKQPKFHRFLCRHIVAVPIAPDQIPITP